MTVFTKVKMAQQVFDFFDYDKDGYWCSRESRECSFHLLSGQVRHVETAV